MKHTAMIAALMVATLAVAADARRDRSAQSDRRPTCVLDTYVSGPVVRDDLLLYFQGEPDRRRSYLGRFKGGRCPLLTRFSSVIVERQGGRYCEGDKVHAFDPTTGGRGPACILDRLQPFAGDVDDRP